MVELRLGVKKFVSCFPSVLVERLTSCGGVDLYFQEVAVVRVVLLEFFRIAVRTCCSLLMQGLLWEGFLVCGKPLLLLL